MYRSHRLGRIAIVNDMSEDDRDLAFKAFLMRKGITASEKEIVETWPDDEVDKLYSEFGSTLDN